MPADACRHRSADPIGVEGCATCRGTVELKVFRCDLHGRCTIAKKVPGAACCAGCGDRSQVAAPVPPM